ncbi:carboxylesterase [Mitsuaria sp. WAJ17]|uniref:alpha/beta hydrolase n=1 Tax=Mitsuaria sp. WAJ17 TaxID=2761452 RepID=UPI0015FF9C37|nr:carboxylesterase [Mitsuaria sp. WAJ17]MBB2487275.1 carboxylesterase [Mitsuaria sp. WAJ17]
MLDTIELQTQAEPTASLIVLHGLGASGDDFVPVCQAMDLRSIGGLRVILPQAPERPVSINGGYRMPAWYDIGLDASGQRVEDERGLRESQRQIEALIAQEVERGIPASRIVLMGFSQGAAMTLMTGLRHDQRLAGLVALSGYLPLAGTTQAERHAANADVPLFLAHGDSDEVVLPARGLASKAELERLGHAVQWHGYPMGHEVCMDEIADVAAFIRQCLA